MTLYPSTTNIAMEAEAEGAILSGVRATLNARRLDGTPMWNNDVLLNSASVAAHRQRLIFTPREKILIRLNITEGEYFPFDHLDAVPISEGKMVVFVVYKGQHTIIEDDAHLFPSDTLIAQLRVLRG